MHLHVTGGYTTRPNKIAESDRSSFYTVSASS